MAFKLFRKKPAPWPVRTSKIAEGRADKPDLAGRRAFMAEHILLQTHIPKTGGSTLSHGLMNIVGAVHTMDLRLNRRVGIDEMSQADLDDLHFLTGHFRFGMHERFKRKPLYIAAVRDPVARAVSNYRFLLTHPDHHQHPVVVDRNFEDAWHALAEDQGPSFFNLQARMLTGTGGKHRPDAAALWEQVEDVYFLVIPQPELNKAIQHLRSAYGVPWTRVMQMNVSQGNEVEVSPAMADHIRETNALDVELYERVSAEFPQKLLRACEYIAERCLLPLDDVPDDTPE